MTLLIFILILGLIVFIHELGHFIMAKKHGIYVYEFSLGFGPKLFSFKRKNDETEYMIKLIPLGGYVMMAGETDEDDKEIKDNQKLNNKSFLQKMSVMLAGVFNNFVLGFVIIFILGLIYGSSFTSNTLSNMDKNYPLYKAGARKGDKIIKINNTTIRNFDDIEVAIAINGEKKPIDVTILKKDNKKVVYKNIKPIKDKETNTYYYGISIENKQGSGLIDAFKYACVKLVSIFKGLIIIIISLFTGKLGISSMSGPVGIFNVVGESAKAGFINLVYLVGFISFFRQILYIILVVGYFPIMVYYFMKNPQSFYSQYGIDPEIVRNLPTIKADAKHCTNCVICTEDIKLGDEIIILKCPGRHCFHANCIKSWLMVKVVCPMCRSDNIL